MLDKIKWFISRAQTISIAEWGYRINQQITARREMLMLTVPSFKEFSCQLNKNTTIGELPILEFNGIFNFFNYSIDITKPIDFHFDISSGKSFPLTFSKKINIRSDVYGSAKVVWEINRLQYLIPLLIEYRQNRNKETLHLFVKIMEDWRAQNQYMKGVNWYSNIEVNIRLINWYWCWLLLSDDEYFNSEAKFEKFNEEVWLPLIYEHCSYSYNNPSYYSSANNHLISEYAGLYVATSLWKFKESAQWHKYAKAGLEKEILLQHHPSGINKEEAAEYIQFITDFFLISYIVGKQYGDEFSSSYKKMLLHIVEYINVFLDSKLNFPKYGDEDDGRLILPDADTHSNNFVSILSTASVLFDNGSWKKEGVEWDIKSALLTTFMAGKTIWDNLQIKDDSIKSVFYKDEGHFYFKALTEDKKEIYAHFDVAELGFLSIAAHGHSDALSFTLNVDGFPFLVDPGTYTYHTHPEWRKYFVSALAHNTISVNGKNQAKLAGPTLWLDHFTCRVLLSEAGVANDIVRGQHNGYLKDGVEHIRTISFNKKQMLFEIIDEIIVTKGEHEITMPYHFHPSVSADTQGGNSYILSRTSETDLKVKIEFPSALTWEKIMAVDGIPLGWYSPSFMVLEPASLILGKSVINKSQLYKTKISIF